MVFSAGNLTSTGNVSGSSTSTGSFGAGYIDNKLGIGTTSPDEGLHLKSKNILLALESAKKKKMSTIFLTSNKVDVDLINCDVMIQAPGNSTDKIQEAHLVIYHIICYMVELKLINEGIIQYKD